MKTRNNFVAALVLSSVVCLLPIILSIVLYNDLPQQIAIHWDSAGNPDNFAPKAVAAFGLPFLLAAINLLSKLKLYHDPKRSNTSQAMQVVAAWTPPLLSLIVVPITLFIAMGAAIPIALVVPPLVGVLLIICGNYLPKNRQNYTIGIRLAWTLHNADNWNKTHRMAGYLYIFAGLILIAGTFISHHSGVINGMSLTVFVVILLVIAPIIYSFMLYRKTGKGIDETDEADKAGEAND